MGPVALLGRITPVLDRSDAELGTVLALSSFRLQGESGDLKSCFIQPFHRAAGSFYLFPPKQQDTISKDSQNLRPFPKRGRDLAGRIPPYRKAGRASQEPR